MAVIKLTQCFKYQQKNNELLELRTLLARYRRIMNMPIEERLPAIYAWEKEVVSMQTYFG